MASPLRFAIRALCLAAISAPITAQTQPVAPSPDSTRPSGRGPRDRGELEAFIDGLITAQMNDQHVAGGMVTVVKDGAVLLSKGYGWADVTRRIPVDPERTLFRPGSVSKLFTWTAVMQQVERGTLDLDRDVNEYLDFKLATNFPEPITLRHLMTHTAGFEDDARDLISADSTRLRPMGEWLPAHQPARVRPPGTFSSYSNYGTAVAGYIVERVSGKPFAQYVQSEILDPLGMTSATAAQPLPPRLTADMSVGYQWTDGHLVGHSFEYLPGAAPAGMMSASAGAMATFMLAHLSLGAFPGGRILADSTARLMQTRAFGHHPDLPGFALGFYESSSHGLRIIGHGGDSQWFHTELILVPAEGLGVYVSFNTDTGGGLTGPFVDAFLDHYYPTPAEPVVLGDFLERGHRFAGTYLENRRSYTTYLTALSLSGGTEISVGADSTLVMRADGQTRRLVPIGPLLFRDVAGHELVGFKEDAQGTITHAFMGNAPMIGLERLAWHEAPALHRKILGLGAVTFLLIVWSAIKRRFRRDPAPIEGPLTIWGRRLLLIAAIAGLAFLAALLVLSQDILALVFGEPSATLKWVLVLPVIATLATDAALLIVVAQWTRSQGSIGERLRASAAVLVALLFVWSLWQWKLVGWNL